MRVVLKSFCITAMFCCLIFVGCVDVPTKGVNPTDVTTTDIVRIVNATSGRDTVIIESRDSVFLFGTSTSDSFWVARTIVSKTVAVDFNRNPLKVELTQFNGNKITESNLSSGSGSSYYSVDAGSRQVVLSSNVEIIDSTVITDIVIYVHNVISQTVSLSSQTDIAGSIFQVLPIVQTRVVFTSNQKGTLFVHPKNNLGNYITFITERMTYEQKGFNDSVLVRLINAIPSDVFSLSLSSNPLKKIANNISFNLMLNNKQLGYRGVDVEQSGSSMYLSNSSATVDSVVNISLSFKKRYTFLAWSDTTGVKLTEFIDD